MIPGPGHLDRPQARVGQRSERLHAEVERRMGQAGDAPRAADQPDRLGRVQPGLGHARGPAVAQVAGERLADAGDLPGPRQLLGQVPAAQDRAGEGSPQSVQVDRQPLVAPAARPSTAAASPGPRGAVPARRAGPSSSSRTKWPRRWSSRPSRWQLSSTPATSSTPSRSASGRAIGQGRDRVVVGDRQRREPHRGRGVHHLAGRADAVGVGRVHVQVGPGAGTSRRS